MKNAKKTLALLIAVLMMLSLLTACGNAGTTAPASTAAPEAPAETAPAEEAPVEAASYPMTFTDMAGVEITLDKEVKTVYIVGSVQPLVALYRYYRGSSDGLLGCPAASQSIISSSVFSEIWPDILSVEPHTDDANAEDILALNPDVVFMTGSASGDAYTALVNAGLTVVSFPTAGSGDDNNTFETVKNWLNQMAVVFGDSKAADKLISYNDTVLADVTAKLADVADEDKPSVLIVFQLSDNSLKVAGSGHYSQFWIENTGAVNAAAEIEKLQEVDIEQVMTWNPDIIYLTTFSPAMPDDLYNNTFDGFDWSQVAAVQKKQVYKIPLGSYRWYAPCCECSLMLQWMASINQPELFADTDINTVVAEFINEFYGVAPTDDQVAALLNPSDKSLMAH